MISPLRATAIIGAGTVVTLATSVVVAKALAVLVGPEGLGRYGLLSSVLGLAMLIGGLGVNTAVVRAIAGALSESAVDRVMAVRRAGLLLALFGGTLGAVALVGLSQHIVSGPLASAADVSEIWILAPALVFQLVSGVELAILNGYHRMRALTLAAAMASVVGGVLTVGVIAALGRPGIALALLVSASAAVIIAVPVRVRALGRAPWTTVGLWPAVRALLRFGGPYTASQIAGTGAQLLVPIVIVGHVGTAGVGHYRAAAMVGAGYLAFLLNAMAHDYLPRVAGAAPDDLGGLIERRTRLVMAIAVPLILAMLALAPIAITLLYTSDFLPAVEVLQWQLVGDLLKLPAWALSFVILARASPITFLGLELIGGAALLAGVIALTPLVGISGAGIAYLLSYAVYYVAAWAAVRRSVSIVPGRLQLFILMLAAICLLLVVARPAADPLRSSVLLGLAVATAALAWPQLWRHHRQGIL